MDRRPHNDRVPNHKGRRPGRRRQPARVLARPRQPRLEADAAVGAELGRGQPRLRIHRGEPAVAGTPDDVGLPAALPVRHPAVVPGRGQGRAALFIHARVVDPHGLPGARVDGRPLVDRRRQEQPAAGHDRGGREPGDARPRHPPVGVGRFEPVEHGRRRGERDPRAALDRKLGVGAAPAPRQLEGVEVVGGDLVEGRVPRALGVAGVGAPFPVGARRLRRSRGSRQADGHRQRPDALSYQHHGSPPLRRAGRRRHRAVPLPRAVGITEKASLAMHHTNSAPRSASVTDRLIRGSLVRAGPQAAWSNDRLEEERRGAPPPEGPWRQPHHTGRRGGPRSPSARTDAQGVAAVPPRRRRDAVLARAGALPTPRPRPIRRAPSGAASSPA